ncbi:MAG: fibronectin type III domain-containing protein [Bdellovibrionales bacterium]|nr:fibronectin type III domain-containing protein [Bdellovibrionales bacterium]
MYTTTVSSVTSPYTITGLTSASTYYIIVRARNTVGSGSSVNSAEVSQITPVAAPTALAATGGSTQINLSWTAAAGASSYKIFRGTVSGTYSQIASGVSATTYSDTTVTNGITYYYVVKSFNGADSASSSEVLAQSIAAFTISSVTSPLSTSLTVSWGSATGATSYDLKYGTAAGTYTTTLTGVTSPNTITGLIAGTTYYVQVVAKNAIGGGAIVNSAESSGATNMVPVISSIVNQSTDADVAKVVNFTLSDGNDILTCAGAMSGVSSNTALVANANIVFAGTMPNCTATITPTTGQTGTSTITLTASDTKNSASSAFVLTVLPCTVATIVWEVQPTAIAAGSAWATAPRVSLRKADNSLCTTNTSPVTLGVTTDTSLQQDAAVTGTAAVTPVAGYATFSAASMTRATTTGFTLAAYQNTIASLNSAAFNVTALAPSKVIFSQQPQTVNRTSNMIPNPTVRVTDTYGNYTTTGGVSITMSLQDNAEGATLGGTLTKTTDATGTAIWNNLTLNVVGSYFLSATPSATYAAVDSSIFSVIQIIQQNTVAVMEMLTGSLVHTGVNTNYPGAAISFGTNNIDGNTAYTWYVVATNTDNQASTVRLRSGTTNVASVSVPAGTTVPTLFPTTFLNTSVTTESVWSLRMEKGTTVLYSSKIIAAQTAANNTQMFIPLTSLDNSTVATPSASTTSVTHTVPNELNFPTYNWDATKIARIDSILLVATSRTNGGSSCVALFNKTLDTQIGSELCNTQATDSYVTMAISPTAMPATAELEVRMRASAGTAFVVKAGLLVRLVSIEKAIAIQRLAPATTALTASTDFVHQRAKSNISSFGTGTVKEYVSCRVKANTSGSGSFIYKNHGTNTSGIAGSTTVAASTNIFSTQSSYTTLEAGPVVTTDNNYQYMNYTHTSGSFALSHCLMETEVSY